MDMDWNAAGKKRPGYRDATAGLKDDAVRAASGRDKSQKGRRQYSLTTRVPSDIAADVIDAIKRQAERLGMTQNDIQLWCLLDSLTAIERGEREPETHERRQAKPILPSLD